jgi:hypothetical protein
MMDWQGRKGVERVLAGWEENIGKAWAQAGGEDGYGSWTEVHEAVLSKAADCGAGDV